MILLIKESEITKYTPLSGNIDLYKLIPPFKAAQINVIKPILGEDLYNKIVLDFSTDSLSDDYKVLYDMYIKNMLIHLATSYYLTAGAYQIDNRGIFKHKADNAESVNQDEIDYIAKQQYKYYSDYKREFYSHIKTLDIPEYKGNNTYKNTVSIGGWVFKSNNC